VPEIEVRSLPAGRIALVGDIDRSERVTSAYRVEEGSLVRFGVDWDVPGWFPEGTGGHHVASLIETLRPVVEGGGVLLGAFRDERIVGLAIVAPRFEPPMAWLAFLHVTRSERRKGVGTALWAEAERRSREAGAASMYVSATPSGPTVDFYLARGCVPVARPHPDLLAEEPEDVHLIRQW
jgi:GNAT superfamily N-acetyltransferase